MVADISENWVTPLDIRMEALVGSVFRTTKRDVETEQRTRDVEGLKADIKQLKTEMVKAPSEQKAKIQAKIDRLEAELQIKRERAKQRRDS